MSSGFKNRPFDGLKSLLDDEALESLPDVVEKKRSDRPKKPKKDPVDHRAKPPQAEATQKHGQQSAVSDRQAVADAELDLFRRQMGGVERIARKQNYVAKATPKHDGPKPDHEKVMDELAALVSGEGDFHVICSEDVIEGLAPSVDRRVLRRLKRGEYAFGRHLDLHGLTKAEAKDRLLAFVEGAKKDGLRCVLVIHGRGLHSKDQMPVLKPALATWLSRGRVARHVLAFSTARPSDGGTGAAYVLLRK